MKIFLILFTLVSTISLKTQVTVSGFVKNCKDSSFSIIETGGGHNITQAWRDKRVKAIINNNSHFKVTIPEEGISSWYIKTNAGNQIFDLIKGENLRFIADFSQEKPLRAIGNNADDFNYSVYANDKMPKDIKAKYLEGIKNRNIDSVLTCRKEYAAFERKMLSQYKNTRQMSIIYYNWIKSKYLYEPFERTMVENIENLNFIDNQTLSKLFENGINDDYAALNTSEYNDLVGLYTIAKFNEKNIKKPTRSERFNFIADDTILKGSTKEVYLSRFMSGLTRLPDSVYNPLLEKYNKIVRSKKLKTYVADRRNDYLKPVISKTEDFSQGSSINEIFKKYKGKIIYVDFWASWCVPCRAEMPNAAQLKDKLKGKDIIFIYFGYNDKEKAWLKARDQIQIEGEHYLLNEKMIKEAEAVFEINGIPHYAIINKNGTIVNKRADRPNEVYEQLIKLIEE
ncbi:MAG: hypothetical protein JWM28_950 [Chitinophagaceae bacterium]|nr:hypothetical protein [Chitinophagaceae bacterium]